MTIQPRQNDIVALALEPCKICPLRTRCLLFLALDFPIGILAGRQPERVFDHPRVAESTGMKPPLECVVAAIDGPATVGR